jgi:hypothetical protein
VALRIRQAWAQLAGGDANAARATLAPLAPTGENERLAHLLAEAAAAWYAGDPAEADRHAAEAEALARDAGQTREMRVAIQIQSIVAHSTGDWQGALRSGLDSSLLAPDLADTLFDGHLCIGEFVLTNGDPLDRVRDVAEDLHAHAVRSGARRAQAYAATLLGEVALVSGVIDEAGTRLHEAVRLSRDISATSSEALASLRLAEAAHARGDAAEAEAIFADALAISRWSPLNGHLLPLGYAALLRATDDAELGWQRLDDANAYLREAELMCAYCGMSFRVAAAITAARAGKLDAAGEYLAAAEATAGLWPGGPWPAALEEARGEIALASGDRPLGLDRLRRAADGFARDERRLDANRVERRLGELG